jgi:hypothetical protein
MDKERRELRDESEDGDWGIVVNPVVRLTERVRALEKRLANIESALMLSGAPHAPTRYVRALPTTGDPLPALHYTVSTGNT